MDPIATKITAENPAPTTLLAAVYQHFRTASLLWRVVENGGVPVEAGTNPGGEGFLITPKGIDGFQVNFRLAIDEVFLSIDPQVTLTITDPTDPGTGASSEWSGETTSSVGQLDLSNSSARLYVIEYPDAFFVINIGSDGLTMASACHAGRVYTPFFTSQVTDYVDGLAVLGRLPLTSDTTGTYYWMSTSTGTSAASLWRNGVSTWTSGATSHEWPATAASINALGRAEPAPVLCFRDPDTFFGEMKYLASTFPTDTPWAIVQDDTTTPRYMHVGDSPTALSDLLISWDPLVRAPTTVEEVDMNIIDFSFRGLQTLLSVNMDPGTTWALFYLNGSFWMAGTVTATGELDPHPVYGSKYVPFAEMEAGSYGYRIDSGSAILTADPEGLLVEMTESTSWEITLTGLGPTTGAHFILQALHLWCTLGTPTNPQDGDNIYIRSETSPSNYSAIELYYTGGVWNIVAVRTQTGTPTRLTRDISAAGLAGTRMWGGQWTAAFGAAVVTRSLNVEFFADVAAGATAYARSITLNSVVDDVSAFANVQTYRIGGSVGAGASWTVRFHGLRASEHVVNAPGAPF